MSELKIQFWTLVQTYVLALAARGELNATQAAELHGLALRVDERCLLYGAALWTKSVQFVDFNRAKIEDPMWIKLLD